MSMKARFGRLRNCYAPNMTVREVAKHFAYRDPYHFSRRFKQVTGFSPDAIAKLSNCILKVQYGRKAVYDVAV